MSKSKPVFVNLYWQGGVVTSRSRFESARAARSAAVVVASSDHIGVLKITTKAEIVTK